MTARRAAFVILALAVSGCATTAGPSRIAASGTAADECRRMTAGQAIVPASSEPRVGTPWWWSAPGSAEPSRSVVKEGLRVASPCPLEQ